MIEIKIIIKKINVPTLWVCSLVLIISWGYEVSQQKRPPIPPDRNKEMWLTSLMHQFSSFKNTLFER